MKKVSRTIKKMVAAITATVFALGILTGCQSNKLPDCFTKEEVEKQAIEDIELASSNDYQGWVDRFQKDLQGSLTQETYDTLLKEMEKKGAFKEYGKTAIVGQEKDGAKYAGAIVVAKYENGNLTYTISYNEDMELVGFLIK